MANRRRGKDGRFAPAVRERTRTVLLLTEKERKQLRKLSSDDTISGGVRFLLQAHVPNFYGVVEAEDVGLTIDEQLWKDML